jgi:myo-inositol-1(or 4)-monophosphatase
MPDQNNSPVTPIPEITPQNTDLDSTIDTSQSVLPPVPALAASVNLEVVQSQVTAMLLAIEPELRRALLNEKPIELKSDRSLVTEFDKMVERVVTAELLNVIPGSVVLGEEADKGSEAENRKVFESEYVWVIDPIDGTTNFAYGLPLCGVSLGLMRREPEGLRAVHGAILLPGSCELITLEGDKVVHHCLRFGEKKEVSSTQGLGPDAHRPIFYSEVIPTLDVLQQGLDMARFRYVGASALNLTFCALGRGSGTATRACFWDFAGGIALAEKAGLTVRDVETGLPKTHYNADDFVLEGQKCWKLKTAILACRDHELESVRAAFGFTFKQ